MINKTTEEQRNKIRRATVITMPDRPSERGIKADAIKNALSTPICGKENSVLAELDRVIDEANSILSPLSETVSALDEEYDNAYILDSTSIPTAIAYEMGKDKTYSVVAGSSLAVTVPEMRQGNRAGLNWTMPTPSTITFTNNTGCNLIVRAEQGVYKTIASGESAELLLFYASNIAAVKLQTLVYHDGQEAILLITRVHNVAL